MKTKRKIHHQPSSAALKLVEEKYPLVIELIKNKEYQHDGSLSFSFFQRRFLIGYHVATLLMQKLIQNGYVESYQQWVGIERYGVRNGHEITRYRVILEEKKKIREWFGVEVDYDRSTKFNEKLDEFLTLYREAMYAYFNCSERMDNYQSLIVYSKNHLTSGQTQSIEWFETKGIENIETLALLTEVNDEDNAVHEITYYLYLLKEELDAETSDELRSCLVNSAMDLPELLRAYSSMNN